MFGLPKYGDGVCLARLADLLDALSIDRARLQRIAVVIAGSNGKGSTAAFCAGIGRAYGLRTGLFTSPHLRRFNERIQVDGEMISEEAAAAGLSEIREAIAGWDASPTFFEITTALALAYFYRAQVELAVLETGMGGRAFRIDPSGAVSSTRDLSP